MKNITFEQQAKTWKSCPEAAQLGNETLTLGFPCENDNFQLLAKPGSLAVKKSNEEIKDLNKDLLMKTMPCRLLANNLEIWKPKICEGIS